jgi:peptidoglycan/LPS O-acetylase OafA/YrhL
MLTTWGPSLEQKSALAGDRPAGFDYLRIILATAVIVWHSFGISYGRAWTHSADESLFRPVIMSILPMFFALSGFLVAGSLSRNSAMSTFLGLRFVRIFPALIVESILSALVIGPLLTVFPLNRYFSDPKFWTYLLNIVGDIHYTLPGVFLNNPFAGVVNGQLSTVPWELRCYIALTALALLGIVRRRRAFFGAVILMMLAAFAFWGLPHAIANGYTHNNVGGMNLVFAFLCGVLIYRFKDVIPWSGRLAAISTLVLISALLIPGGDYFCAPPTAYVTIYLGLMNPRKIFLLKGADYSYGLYLYGAVIQQSVAQLGPWALHWYVNLPISLAIASLFAAFSWHLVEKPALKLKAFLPVVERLFSRLPRLKAKPELAATAEAAPEVAVAVATGAFR